jgi:hypothetical protein
VLIPADRDTMIDGVRHLVLAAAVAVLACSSETPASTERDCPAAPAALPDECVATADCYYAAPRLLTGRPDLCNGAWLLCRDGEPGFLSSMKACPSLTVPVCSAPVVEGATCERPLDYAGAPSNRECFVADIGQRLDAAEIAGRTCACDVPGPIWRCVSGSYRWTPPPPCHALAQLGDAVKVNIVAEDPPNLDGGTFAEGDYVLASAVEYVGTGGVPGGADITLRQTMRIVGTTFESVETHAGPQEVRISGTLTTSGGVLNAVDTCPPWHFLFAPYAATRNEIRLLVDGERGQRVLTLTRR